MTIRRALTVSLLSLSLALSVAGLAWAQAYTVSFAAPASGAILSGGETIHVDVSSSTAPTTTAIKMQPAGSPWGSGAYGTLSPAGSGWEAVVDTNVFANGNYTLIARAWAGDYNPDDPNTYGEASIPVKVNNAPATPSGLKATANGGNVTVSWDPIPHQDRSDFNGYQVFRTTPSGSACPGIEEYSLRTTVFEPSYSESAGDTTYCYVIVANRQSPTSGSIASDPTLPVLANKSGQIGGGGSGGGGGGNGGGSGGPVTFIQRGSAGGSAVPAAPEAPEVREIIPDGPYSENLPYTPISVDEFNRIVSDGGGIAGNLVGPNGQRRAMTLVAAGLLLGVAAMQIRRFVAA
jgi:hypothetical protein